MRPGFAGRRVGMVSDGALGVLFLAATVSSILGGSSAWWLWLLATLSVLVMSMERQRAAARVLAFTGERRGPRNEQEVLREQHVFRYGAVAAVAFVGSQFLLPSDDGASAVRTLLGAVLFLIAILAALAAGWSAVWEFKTEANNPTGREEPERDNN
jgi:phosphatidylglycerophosphate synthase